MPFYRCLVPQDALTFAQRQQIARAFTDVHCGSTGAPPSFVQVAFFPNTEGDFAEPYYIDGGNRAGRPPAVRDKLLADLMRAFREVTGVPAHQLGGRITEGPASWSMEGGQVLPEPGQEGPEWYAHAQPASTGHTS